MIEATRFLTSLAQALAKMSLYGETHPARASAADASFHKLRELLAFDAHPAFSFLGDEVVYAQRALRDLEQWDWARKLSSAGVQRLEFERGVTEEEYRGFLESVLSRLQVVQGLAESSSTSLHGAIRFGGIGVRGTSGADLPAETVEAAKSYTENVDFTEEADAVQWMHEEVMAARRLPLAEAEAVVASLSASMHSASNAIVPLLTLKEFDQYTTTHSINVSVLAMALAEHFGLAAREVRSYGMAGLLHDLGKVKVPLEILRKPGKLTDEEFAIMRSHPTEGARMILQSDGRLDLCAVVAFEHHIMINGSGYPVRQRRCDCHHASMLVHVCDVFDALRTHRPYRVAWETDAIMQYLEGRIGSELEPDATRGFMTMVRSRGVSDARAESIDSVQAAEGAPSAELA
jgi:putative nucleotidyltransferase with HDIG domain